MPGSVQASETPDAAGARTAPLWPRQLLGLALLTFWIGMAVVVFFFMPTRQRSPAGVDWATIGSAAAVVAGLLLIGRYLIFLGWRKIDGFQFEAATGTVEFTQRKLGGGTTRTIRIDQLAAIREMHFTDLGGNHVECFDFCLRNGEKLRFHPWPTVVPFDEVKRRLVGTGLLRG